MFALMEAVGVVDTHLLGSHRRGSSGVWPDTGRKTARPTPPLTASTGRRR
jgi:DNA-3-methyladenine glycosylase I